MWKVPRTRSLSGRWKEAVPDDLEVKIVGGEIGNVGEGDPLHSERYLLLVTGNESMSSKPGGLEDRRVK
ncbi:MAG: hypothetical protein U9R47_05240, partial [Actinomycetota bacterium]|nr:hypothetical protein [Actinomycetota bacterium]